MEINRSILDILLQYLPLLIPVVLIQLALLVTALVDLIRREKTHGPKWVWVLVIVLVNFIGPIIYFIAGRKDE
jgi:drug/metabolite transporter (DMT)-like permease